jgi:hypothetical protein
MDAPASPPPPTNPVTQAAHRREVFQQITLPLIVGGIGFLALFVGVIVALVGGAQEASGEFVTSRWADVSLLWLLPPQMLVSLICLGALGGMAYGMFKLLGALPTLTYQVQTFFSKVQAAVDRGADLAVAPVLKVKANAAALRQFHKSLLAPFKKGQP